jgi:hypothetical protein
MAEHQLHRAQIGAVLEQMGREGMAELVRRDLDRRTPAASAYRLRRSQKFWRVIGFLRAVTNSQGVASSRDAR